MKSEAIAAVGAGATYIVEVVAPDGTVSQRSVERNNVPVQGLNHIAAVVFKGDRADVRVALDDGPTLDAVVPTGTGRPLPSPGDRVRVRIDPSGVMPFRR